MRRGLDALGRLGSRLSFRLLAVNLVVVCVPLFGIEFARLYERRLLDALQRDMDHQALVVAEFLRRDAELGIPLGDPAHETVLVRIARSARARIRLLDATGNPVADSHAHGPPEGVEPGADRDAHRVAVSLSDLGPRWDDVPRRIEVRQALAGHAPAAFTRVRDRAPGVLLFLARPVRHAGRVVGVVYVTRSTTPVMQDMHRVRRSLGTVLAVTLAITIAVTVLLALSITRPLARLAAAARRIAHGEKDVAVPRGGPGEVGELADAFATMTERLDARLVHSRDFASDVAHELKSPLTSIRGAAELLEEGAADDPRTRARFLGNILLDVERLDRIVSRLLELGRVEAASDAREPIDLGAMLRDLADRASTVDVAVEVTIDDAPIVLVRIADVDAAIGNVLANAVRFSPPGRPVRVRLGREDGGPVITITDEGPGIPVADQARVFDRFFTTDGARRGTGLGLPIARSAMIAHGGMLDLTSSPGRTCFRLKFPAAVCVHGGFGGNTRGGSS